MPQPAIGTTRRTAPRAVAVTAGGLLLAALLPAASAAAGGGGNGNACEHRANNTYAKLLECVTPGNYDKARAAPVTAIIGMDMAFYDKLPKLFPHADARSWFLGKKEFADTTAFRNSSLQGAYLILAARALGLDCGPMSGFDHAKIDAAFWAGTEIKTNFICNLGHGDPAKLFGRSPRLAFDEACRIV